LAKKPRLLLLDANAVIAALEAGIWEPLVAAYDVGLPSIVVHTELIHYHDSASGRRIAINADEWVGAGTVREIEMTPGDLHGTLSRFREPFVSQLDPGETEAIAYMLTLDEEDETRFVSADSWAIQAAAMLGLGHRMQSLEEVLEQCGQRRRLPSHHGRDFLRQNLAEGGRRMVTREGLS
jgi:hypothetical protein